MRRGVYESGGYRMDVGRNGPRPADDTGARIFLGRDRRRSDLCSSGDRKLQDPNRGDDQLDLSLRGLNHLASVHVRTKRRRNDDRTVLLLTVLENRDQRTTDGKAGAVQRMDEFGLATSSRAEL